jgi:hypothetical protein
LIIGFLIGFFINVLLIFVSVLGLNFIFVIISSTFDLGTFFIASFTIATSEGLIFDHFSTIAFALLVAIPYTSSNLATI